MKRHFTLLFILLPLFVAAQIVTTTPAFITSDYTGAVTVIFDATQGNKGLMNHTGDVYAHTGVITNQSATDRDWKHAPTWGDNAAKYKLERVAGEANKYRLDITPSIAGYYNLVPSEVVKKLAFVFRSATSPYKEGKTADGGDIFVDIYEPGLNVTLSATPSNQLVNSGTTVAFTANASEAANLVLTINGTTEQTATNATVLTFSKLFSAVGDYKCVISATNGTVTVKDSLTICVAQSPDSQNRPAGTEEGINYFADHTKVVLVMYAKDKSNVVADNVFVIGDFNDWSFSNSYQMKKDAANSGYFWIELTGLTPQKEYAFQYAVKIGNNIVKITDAFSEKLLDGNNDKWITSSVYPNLKPFPEGKTTGYVSVLQTNKPQFAWSSATTNFQAPDRNNLVIYELWTYDFSSARTIKEVTARLDYLKNLGINAIELMPIIEFDGNISWGYNPNHFFAPDKAYGTPDDYKKFIDECHKRGIAVIFDVVFNHASGNHPWAKLYWNTTTNNVVASNNPWFNTSAPHSDNVHQDFNHDFDGTRNYFKRALQHWINEYKIDGYRMDLSKGLCGPTCSNRVAIVFDYFNAAKAAKSNVYFILEHWESSEEQNYVNNGMLCWGGGGGMNNTYSQTAMGWLKDGDNFSAANKKGWVYYCESHDEQRNFFKAKKWGNGNLQTNETARLNRVPLNVGFNVMLQGPKMLWQFQEMGYDFTICYNAGNAASQDASPGDAACDRLSTKPIPDNLGWFQNDLRMSAYKKVAQMLELRKRYSDMFLNGTCAFTGGSGASARYMRWSHNTDRMVVVGNFNVEGGTQYTGAVQVAPFGDTGTWYEYFSQTTLNVSSTSQQITLQPGEIKIYTNTYQNLPEIPTKDVEVYDDGFRCAVFPTITNSEIYIEASEKVRQIDVYSLRSEKIFSFGSRNSINVSSLPSGMYLMIVTFDKRQEAFKFIRE